MKPIESALESKVIRFVFFSLFLFAGDTLLPSQTHIHNHSLETQLKLIVERKLIYQIKSGHKLAQKKKLNKRRNENIKRNEFRIRQIFSLFTHF